MGFNSGVVITSGNTSTIPLTTGTNPGSIGQMATAYTSGTPGELRQTGSPAPLIIQDLDVLAGAFNYFNGAILEFDFKPVDTKVQFRYIFGSEEYSDGTNINYQCSSYNDKFGFLISGPGIAGGQGFSNDAKNIARLANGSEVSINSVNNGVVGSSATSQNASYCTAANGAWTQNTPTPEFGLNNGHIDGTQLNGNTKTLTASQSGLIPGQTYHIKLIVTDVNDATYDSVVYLEAGSFTTEENCAAGSDQSLCGTTSTTLAASSPLTGTWSVISGSANFTNNNSPTSGVIGLSNGVNILRWTSSDLTCFDEVSITVTATPLAPTVVTPVAYCQNATASALTATGSSLLWYTALTGGTGSATAPTPITTTAGSTTYYVSQTVLGCESPRASITVNVTATPLAPTVVTPVAYCQNATASALTATGSNLLWYTALTGGTGSATAPTPITTTAGSTTYYVSQTVLGCESPRASIMVNVTATPLAPIVGTITQPTCSVASGSVALSGLPAPGTWTVTANPGGATISNIGTTAVFSGLSPNTYTFTVTNASGCTSVASGTVTVLAQPALPLPPSGSLNQSFCENINPTIANLIITGTNIKWYDALVGGNLLPLTKPLENGITYYASQTIGNCESNRIGILVTITKLPNISFIKGCNGSDYVISTTTSQNIIGLTYQWYSASNLNAIIGTNSSIIITTKGDYILKILLNGCSQEYPFISVESLYCEVPKGISPNDDGKNDFFDLTNLNVKKLEIFNRYGMKVYSHLNYKKEWEGKTDNGQELPDGTYYYLIEFEDRLSKTGWVYLSREY
jgi:gliding motility-associated-like protein